MVFAEISVFFRVVAVHVLNEQFLFFSITKVRMVWNNLENAQFHTGMGSRIRYISDIQISRVAFQVFFVFYGLVCNIYVSILHNTVTQIIKEVCCTSFSVLYILYRMLFLFFVCFVQEM